MEPLSTVYVGLPMIALASVDYLHHLCPLQREFPPLLIVKLIPFKICLSSTDTFKSFI